MNFAQQADDYLALRRALGHDLSEAGRLLPRFAAYLEKTGAEFVSIQATLSWSCQPDVPAGSTVPSRRMTVARGFARYMAGIDPRTEVPPPGLVASRQHWRPPFIYSDADVMTLMAQVRRLVPSPVRAATFETLIGLLASAGLRVGEAIRLRREHVNWSEGVLFIERSKFGKSRHVPLHTSTVGPLAGYDKLRDEAVGSASVANFFVSLHGKPLIYTDIFSVFRRACDTAGVGAGSPVRPRIHDLRHSFAVHCLAEWYSEGADVQARLPWLSTYMGHREPRYTYWYLSAAPELLAHAAARLDALAVTR